MYLQQKKRRSKKNIGKSRPWGKNGEEEKLIQWHGKDEESYKRERRATAADREFGLYFLNAECGEGKPTTS